MGYTRQSSRRANGSEASPEAQDETNERRARERGCQFLRHFRDIGRSGYDPDAKRAEFDELLSAARAGQFQELYVYNVSRFSRRDPKDSLPVVQELFRYGITIVSAAEGVFTPDSTLELIMLILRLDAAHQESKNKSIAVTDAKRKAREAGGWVGGRTPYGFGSETVMVGRIATQRLVAIPAEADTIRRVADLIKTHRDSERQANAKHLGSISGICQHLNETRVPTRAESRGYVVAQRGGWTTGTLRRILLDPSLAGLGGDPVYSLRDDGTPTQRIVDYRIRRDPETQEPIVVGDAILPLAEWFEIRDWVMGRSTQRGAARGTTLLSGLGVLFCECGRPMASRTAAGTVKVAGYRCTRPWGKVAPGQHEGGNNIAQGALDEYVVRRIFARMSDDSEDTLALLAIAGERLAKLTEAPETRAERSALTAERADATRALEQLYDDLRHSIYDGEVGRARFLSEKSALEARMAALDLKIREIGDVRARPVSVDAWTNGANDPMGEGSWWATADTEDRRMFVSLFVDRVTVAKAKHRGGRNLEAQAHVRASLVFADE